jgi:hypothetical protein
MRRLPEAIVEGFERADTVCGSRGKNKNRNVGAQSLVNTFFFGSGSAGNIALQI